jgi:hypothetical protein
VTIGLGIWLILLGLGSYFGTERVSVTALIPAAFGVVFLVLGLLGYRDNLRKHVMHAAAALALIGFLGTAARLVPALLKYLRNEPIEHPIAVLATAIMAVSCAVFVWLCVRSFIAARRARKQERPVMQP